ncbi:hypothetical protein CBR_g10805 [Chara braunii]|uniref:Uncharacterized protein n=1 Tax=Chara braunii TaxID=69332 RepID=A0A388KP90_CHABU|nr:hypothetical protein CBR_g10805 [Chara braunii]|eukprot:GBG71869.1 hypothetical protein CBR_g10805 [Chara braunii]
MRNAMSMPSPSQLTHPHRPSSVSEEGLFSMLAEDLTVVEDKQAETLKAIKDELFAELRKEEKKLDCDAWMYGTPRSQI